MTVPAQNTETVYMLAGAALGPFNSGWTCEDLTQVAVSLDSGAGPVLLGPTLYTVAGGAPLTGGVNVTLGAGNLPVSGAWAAGSSVTLTRAIPLTQPSALGQSPTFSPSNYETSLDHVARQVQDVKTALGRVLSYPPGQYPGALPPAESLKGLFLGFDATTGLPQPQQLPAIAVTAGSTSFATRALAGAAVVPGGTPFLITAGYSAAGDGGGSLYVAAGGAAAGNFQSADGQWWRPVPIQGAIDARVLGFSSSAADNAAFVATANTFCGSGVELVFGPTLFFNYAFLGSGLFTCPVRMAGGILSATTAITLTFSGGFGARAQQCFALSGGAAAVFSGVPMGGPEWWGAQRGVPGFDCTAALQAAINALPVTLLQAGAYYYSTTLQMQTNDRTLRGMGASQLPSAAAAGGAGTGLVSTGASQLIMTSAGANGIQMGSSSATLPGALLENARIEDLDVLRATAAVPYGVAGAAAIANPVAGTAGAPTGIVQRWCGLCYLTRVMSIEHSYGFSAFGTVETYRDNCTALRFTAAANAGNDFFVGFYQDNSAPFTGLNSGNASIYYDKCRVFSNVGVMGAPAYTYNAGLQTYQGWTDTFINRFETGVTQYGIDAAGRTAAGADVETEDLLIEDCVLDSCSLACVRAQTGGGLTALTIMGCYLATLPTATAVLLGTLNGAALIEGNQQIAVGGATGLSAVNCNGVTSSGNLWNGPVQPIILSGCTRVDIQDRVRAQSAGTFPALTSIGTVRGYFRLDVDGVAGAFASGVNLSGAANSKVECQMTMVDPACVTGGSANKLLANGVQIVATGAFSAGVAADCLAGGIMA